MKLQQTCGLAVDFDITGTSQLPQLEPPPSASSELPVIELAEGYIHNGWSFRVLLEHPPTVHIQGWGQSPWLDFNLDQLIPIQQHPLPASRGLRDSFRQLDSAFLVQIPFWTTLPARQDHFPANCTTCEGHGLIKKVMEIDQRNLWRRDLYRRQSTFIHINIGSMNTRLSLKLTKPSFDPTLHRYHCLNVHLLEEPYTKFARDHGIRWTI